MISEDKQALIRKRLCQGVAATDIAIEAQVSRKTVERLKKCLPSEILNDNEAGDYSVHFDNSTMLTKSEARYTAKLGKEIALYEDTEEGWCYHLTKDDHRLKTSGCWWAAIVYPESAPERWIEQLRNTGLRLAISPLHDKDVWNHDSPEMVNAETGEIIPAGDRYKAGDRKKPHWHIIVVSDQRVSAQDINNQVRRITYGPYLQKCRSLRNAYDYFLHINAPEKYQGYDKDEIQIYNNFHLEPNKYEVGMMQAEILRTIKEHNMTTIIQLMDFYMDAPEYVAILAAKPGIFTSLIHAQWHKANPNGRIQKIYVMTDEEKRAYRDDINKQIN